MGAEVQAETSLASAVGTAALEGHRGQGRAKQRAAPSIFSPSSVSMMRPMCPRWRWRAASIDAHVSSGTHHHFPSIDGRYVEVSLRSLLAHTILSLLPFWASIHASRDGEGPTVSSRGG